MKLRLQMIRLLVLGLLAHSCDAVFAANSDWLNDWGQQQAFVLLQGSAERCPYWVEIVPQFNEKNNFNTIYVYVDDSTYVMTDLNKGSTASSFCDDVNQTDLSGSRLSYNRVSKSSNRIFFGTAKLGCKIDSEINMQIQKTEFKSGDQILQLMELSKKTYDRYQTNSTQSVSCKYEFVPNPNQVSRR